MENELIKKYYIEQHNKNDVDFCVVYGTKSNKFFNVKKIDSIVGWILSDRIPLNSDFLFDDFSKAKKVYLKTVEELQQSLWQDYEELEKEQDEVRAMVAPE